MSEEQTPQTSETECRTVDSPEFEDEECWLYNDDDMETQKDKSLGYTESFLRLQDILQENKINSIDDSNTCQAGSAKEDCSHSDSNIYDNVKVIIGNIKTNPSMYMEMLTDLNSEGEQDVERTAPVQGSTTRARRNPRLYNKGKEKPQSAGPAKIPQ